MRHDLQYMAFAYIILLECSLFQDDNYSGKEFERLLIAFQIECIWLIWTDKYTISSGQLPWHINLRSVANAHQKDLLPSIFLPYSMKHLNFLRSVNLDSVCNFSSSSLKFGEKSNRWKINQNYLEIISTNIVLNHISTALTLAFEILLRCFSSSCFISTLFGVKFSRTNGRKTFF